MQPTYLDHPTEEALERFVLRKSEEEELEVLETHILACDSCVARLETLESEIANIKLAVSQMSRESIREQRSAASTSWRNWFTIPKMSWAGAVAALAIGIAIVPQFVSHKAPLADVNLTAYRGLENPLVPAGERLHMRLNAADLSENTVNVEIVDSQGATVWKGSSEVRHDQVEITVPSMRKKGTHFVRLYAAAKDNPNPDLLREFAFQVK
jgi:anti-sigma factor RsiW